mgnify:CR=1 FL=1
MNKLLLVILGLVAVMGLSACNTMRGIGRSWPQCSTLTMTHTSMRPPSMNATAHGCSSPLATSSARGAACAGLGAICAWAGASPSRAQAMAMAERRWRMAKPYFSRSATVLALSFSMMLAR